MLFASRLDAWRRGGGAVVVAVYWRNSRQLRRVGCLSARAAGLSATRRFCVGDGNDKQYASRSMAMLLLFFVWILLRAVHAGFLAVSAVPMHYGCTYLFYVLPMIVSVCLAVGCIVLLSRLFKTRVFFIAGAGACTWANVQAEAALDVRLLRINAELERKGYLVRVAFAKQRCTSWIEFHTSEVEIGNVTAD